MNQVEKDNLLKGARTHVHEVQADLDLEIKKFSDRISEKEEGQRPKDDSEDLAMIEQAIDRYSEGRLEDLKKLYSTPYFQRLDIDFLDNKKETYYIGKFSYDQKNIVSWTAPLASIRFDTPGDVSYTTPDGYKQDCQIERKDQFLIADGNILFMASESLESPRELIYQDYFSQRRNEFALPEIVAQMEKAQDEVIRAHHDGPFMISGPAGSGKTTLALHRVAYLTESPDTAYKFPPSKVLVLVQDPGTKQYFSKLLPDLGIHNVKIITYPEWTLNVLNIDHLSYQGRLGDCEDERDLYECTKIQALENLLINKYINGREFSTLDQVYNSHFSQRQKEIFKRQKQDCVLDRFDLTILMIAKKSSRDGFKIMKEVGSFNRNNVFVTKKVKQDLNYSLIVLDEFQNYIPKQLELIKNFADPKSQSILYVGDVAQKTQFGTSGGLGKSHPTDGIRSVKLQKVYRNKKSILKYLQSLNYPVEIPENMADGGLTKEVFVNTQQEKIDELSKIISSQAGNVGIIAMDADDLIALKEVFVNEKQVFCLSVREAQGVEFETVCFLPDNFGNKATHPDNKLYQSEILGIRKDLTYVALTRAISNLFVIKYILPKPTTNTQI